VTHRTLLKSTLVGSLHLLCTLSVLLRPPETAYAGVMINQAATERFTFDAPAVYQIRVQGSVKASWSDCLEGMTISVTVPEGGSIVTTLEGVLSDQAALAGVLSTLYELHLPMLEVKCLSAEQPAHL
jgi:hypothetical protein